MRRWLIASRSPSLPCSASGASSRSSNIGTTCPASWPRSAIRCSRTARSFGRRAPTRPRRTRRPPAEHHPHRRRRPRLQRHHARRRRCCERRGTDAQHQLDRQGRREPDAVLFRQRNLRALARGNDDRAATPRASASSSRPCRCSSRSLVGHMETNGSTRRSIIAELEKDVPDDGRHDGPRERDHAAANAEDEGLSHADARQVASGRNSGDAARGARLRRVSWASWAARRCSCRPSDPNIVESAPRLRPDRQVPLGEPAASRSSTTTSPAASRPRNT